MRLSALDTYIIQAVYLSQPSGLKLNTNEEKKVGEFNTEQETNHLNQIGLALFSSVFLNFSLLLIDETIPMSAVF